MYLQMHHMKQECEQTHLEWLKDCSPDVLWLHMYFCSLFLFIPGAHLPSGPLFQKQSVVPEAFFHSLWLANLVICG